MGIQSSLNHKRRSKSLKTMDQFFNDKWNKVKNKHETDFNDTERGK